jgi:hypothetical protein
VVIKKIKSIFELDLRSLAFFRIVIGIVILGDLLIRLIDFTTFYTDSGIHSRSFIIEDVNQYRFSLYYVVGRSEQVLTLMLLHFAVGVAFVLGFKTRLMTFLIWLLTVSIQNRNYTILNNGDSLIRCLLFFGFFLPLGARYSLDSLKQKVNSNNTFFSIGNIGIIGQLLLMYIFTGILKDGPQWRVDYSALDIALMLDQFTTSLGVWASQFHGLNRFLTWFTIVLEIYIPLVLLSPWWRDQIRLAMIAIFTMFHISISALLRIGIFTPASIAGWMIYIPGFVWDRFEKTVWYNRITHFFLNKAIRLDLKPDQKNIAYLAFPMFLFILQLNISSVNKWNIRQPSWMNPIAQVLRLDQSWGMFAPYPVKDDGWIIIAGELQNKEEIDLIRFKRGPVSYTKPDDFSEIFPNQRWQKFLTNLRYKDHTQSLLQYGRWICRTYNSKRANGEKLDTFQIIYMEEFSEAVGKVRDLKKRVLWNHNCFAK